jgi:hypothetical protein
VKAVLTQCFVFNHQDTKTPRFGFGFVPWSLGGKKCRVMYWCPVSGNWLVGNEAAGFHGEWMN